MQPLLLLELNEVNFEYVRAYGRRGELPILNRLLEEFGYSETTSEEQYEHLEPWIQWVTAHTGKTLTEHGIFRLGDIQKLNDVDQIWERLEREKSIRVGAISPMNAKNELANGGFFVPDPWTNTSATGSYLLRKMSKAISQAVNENANGKLAIDSVWWLAVGVIANARLRNYIEYVRQLFGSIRHPWKRAIFLDLLLADTFISQVKRSKPGFASVFLNAAAHIQHHYMFSSSVYMGPHRNPDWYLPVGKDPLLEVYRVYDRIVNDILRCLSSHRVMIATGLHQDPHDQITYYWRLSAHAQFLRKVGVPFAEVRALMSRDFMLLCNNEEEATIAQRRIESLRDLEGRSLFEVDNRGSDLFVMLTYAWEIGKDFVLRSEEGVIKDFYNDVAFVALKNGKHNGIGYFVDTGAAKDSLPLVFALTELPERIAAAIG